LRTSINVETCTVTANADSMRSVSVYTCQSAGGRRRSELLISNDQINLTRQPLNQSTESRCPYGMMRLMRPLIRARLSLLILQSFALLLPARTVLCRTILLNLNVVVLTLVL